MHRPSAHQTGDARRLSVRPVMLLVLGAHRSGTSVVARMLECLGARPSTHLHEPLPNNPKGFFEDVDVERFNEYRLLPELGVRWHDIGPVDWTRLTAESRQAMVVEAAAIVRRNFSEDAPVFVLKDPRICVLLPFWLETLQHAGFDVRFVCAVRDPLSVARSLQVRDGLGLAHGAMLYASNWIMAHSCATEVPATYLKYDALIERPADELQRVARVLGLSLPGDFQQRVLQAAAQFLDNDLRHSVVTSDELADSDEVPEVAKDVYRALCALLAADEASAGCLRAQIAGLRSDVNRALPLLRSHDNLHGEACALRQELRNRDDEVSGLRGEILRRAGQEEARAWVVELEADVSRLEAERVGLASEVGRLACEVTHLESRANRLVDERREVQRALGDSVQREEEARARVVELEADVSRLQANGVGLATDVARLTSDVSRLESHAQQLAAEARAREEQAKYLQCVVDAIRASSSWRVMAPVRGVAALARSNPWSRARARNEVQRSGLFDPVYYLLANGRSVPEGCDPLGHFLSDGGRLGLKPSPLFDCAYYLAQNPDVLAAGVNPLLHFIRVGGNEGRKPHRTARTGEPEPSNETSAAQVMRLIRESGMFDESFYLEQYPDVQRDGIGAIDHFVLHGWQEGRNPSAHFDTRFYVREHMHDDARGENPLLHYIQRGRDAGNAPSERYGEIALALERRGRGVWPLAPVDRRARAFQALLRHHGGVAGAARAAAVKVATHGPAALMRSVGHQLRRTHHAVPSPLIGGDHAPPPVAGGACGSDQMGAGSMPCRCRILFVGCDGLVAGSQVLLLNELKWLRAHTSIEIRTILVMSGGELLPEYAQCGPTIVWRDLLAQVPDVDARRARLRELFGDIDLVYGNTVVAASTYADLAGLGVPVITHIHELEKSIRALCSPQDLEALIRLTSRFIACSAPVADNLVERHGIDPHKVATVNAFIERRTGARAEGRAGIRRRLGIAETSFVVVGCGTMYARKGVDLFVETAARMKEMGLRDVEFIWIGPQYWDLDAHSRAIMPWRTIERRIEETGLSGKVRFLGQLTSPREHFEAADVFYLPSREDPFPLVCLEAAQVGTPIVCFEGCGGMPEFVADDAGVVVPCLDLDAAAAAIGRLRAEPALRERLGQQAAAKLARLHTDDIALPHILGEIHRAARTSPIVSVIVPVFNHAQFLDRRMESILGQSFRDVEVIVLDDASTDGSLDVAQRYEHLPQVRVIANDRNSGSSFRQWAKGLELARGEFVWIAESDDSSAPEFLEEMLRCLSDPTVALAYSDSRVVDEHDQPLEGYARYYADLDRSHWRMDHVLPAVSEVNYGLGVKNTIPNVSAVVFRKALVTPETLDAISSMQFAGDWMFYLRLAQGRRIAYRSLPLNVHRKHTGTLTHSFNRDPQRAQRLLDEVRAVHEWVLGSYPLAASFRPRLERYLEAQVTALASAHSASAGAPRYPVERILAEAGSVASSAAAHLRKIAFVTTNDGSHDGGSEQLWIHAAQRMARQGHRVMVVIRRWDPEPYFMAEFSRLGIEMAFKDRDPQGALAEFAPDLVVINIGDQDDGTEWYATCRSLSLPYVIVNHLTKEPQYWPIRAELQDAVRAGNRGAVRVYFTSRNNRSLMERRLGCRIPHAEIFHNPLFLDRTRSLPFPPIEGPIRLAMPARMLNIHKGQHVAVEVFGMRKWRERPIELHLYGNGPDEPSIRAQVARMGTVRVHFHDPQWQLPRPDMEAIWRHCHGLLMPSFMEGMPLVLLNAMFYARVPIVTDIGGHREVVEDGVSGFIAREPTPEAMDEALERAWMRLADWEQVGRRARDSMLRFAPEDPVGDLVEKLQLAIIGAAGA